MGALDMWYQGGDQHQHQQEPRREGTPPPLPPAAAPLSRPPSIDASSAAAAVAAELPAPGGMALSPPAANMMGRMESVWRRRTCVQQSQALSQCFQQSQQQQQQQQGGAGAAAPQSSSACAAYLSALRTCDMHSHQHQPTSAFHHRPHF